MKIAVIAEHYTRGMGYIENKLPVALASLGAEVHLITSTRSASPDFPGLGDSVVGDEGDLEGSVFAEDGVVIHCLPVRTVLRRPKFVGLKSLLRNIRPEIVQTHEMTGWTAMDPARWAKDIGYCFFGGAHWTLSVWNLHELRPRLNWASARLRLKVALFYRWPSQLASKNMETCYAATSDCAVVAERYWGMTKRKIAVCPLGTDTDLFHPARTREEERQASALRAQLGFELDDIVCVYTGKFSSEKHPLLLAQAVTRLRKEGLPFRGLFVGDGEEKQTIVASPGCVVVPFRPHRELGDYYRCSDIGVWPTQESMSVLDAAACGVPVVVNHTVQATERFEGNGLTYRLNDLEDLIATLRQLQVQPLRERLGRAGYDKMTREFSWMAIAARRLRDYEQAITRRSSAAAR